MEYSNNKYLEFLHDGFINEAIEYRASCVPDYLYKFFWLTDNLEDGENKKRLQTLENNQLWFAAPTLQNDPYEFRGIYLDEKKLLELGVTPESISTTAELLLKRVLLTSFTANMSDNLPMWAHYANNHRGFCVKYKVRKKHAIRNVTYEDKRISIASIFCSFLRAAQYSDIRCDKNAFLQAQIYATIMQEMFFFKHRSWEYEHEYRGLYSVEKETKGINVSLSELGLSVVEIYCGINCCEHNKKRLSGIAAILEVPCKECKTSSTSFTVFE